MRFEGTDDFFRGFAGMPFLRKPWPRSPTSSAGATALGCTRF